MKEWLMMQQKRSILKKTAVTVLAASLLAGSAAGAVSAKAKHDKDNGKAWGKNQYVQAGKQTNIHFHFYDVDEKTLQWAYASIIRLASQGVFKGYEDGTFRPSSNISRIETIIAAVRLLGLESEAQKPENMNASLNFRDFEEFRKKYPNAVGYLAVALKNDLFSETESKIQADKPATRLWSAVLLTKGLKLADEAKAKMSADLPFKDEDDIPAGSVGYVAVAVEKGIISGYSNGKFLPNKPVTRAELASILDRLNGQLPNQGIEDGRAVTGTVISGASGYITVQKADNTTVSVPLDANVFVFRNGVKAETSAIQPGDQVLVRTQDGKAIFIEVTKTANQVIAFSDSGKVNAYTFNEQGKLATIALIKDVNGTATTAVYNVDSSVKITGGSGVLAVNLAVTVKGENNTVKEIIITG
jgi:hypothetical protein